MQFDGSDDCLRYMGYLDMLKICATHRKPWFLEQATARLAHALGMAKQVLGHSCVHVGSVTNTRSLKRST